MKTILLHHWRQRPLRFITTLIGLALSSSILIGILVASHNTRRAYQDLDRTVAGLPALDVVSQDSDRFNEFNLDQLKSTPDVESSVPMLFRGSLVRTRDQKIRGLVLGIPIVSSPEVMSPLFSDLSRPTELEPWQRFDCLIPNDLAQQFGLKVGDNLQALFRRGFKKLTVKAIIPQAQWRQFASEPSVIVDLKTLQELTGNDDRVDRVRLFMANSQAINDPEVISKLSSRVPTGLKVASRSGAVGLADDLLRAAELGLTFAGALALAMATYILVNTTRMNLEERRKHFAILRCLGGTTGQLSRALIAETIVIATISTLLGIAIGCTLGWSLGHILSRITGAEGREFSVPWTTLAIIAISIPCVTAGVVGLAISRQVQVSPLEAFRELPAQAPKSLPWKQVLAGFVLWFLAAGLLLTVQQERIDPFWGVPAGLLMLVSYLLFLPIGLHPILKLSERWLESRSMYSIDLARYQLMKSPERTLLNTGFLVIALCGSIGLGQSLLSNVSELKRWYVRAFPGDTFLVSQQLSSTVSDEDDPTRNELVNDKEVEWFDSIRFVPAQIDQQALTCIIRDIPEQAPFPGVPSDFSETEAREALRSGKVLLSSVLAKKLNYHSGPLNLTKDGRVYKIEVGGIYVDFTSGGLTLLITRSQAQKLFVVTGYNLIAIQSRGQSHESIFQRMRQNESIGGYVARSGVEIRASIDRAIQGVLVGVWSVVIISFVTGGFGIATTLAMNVIEQSRDFALLRLVGMTSRQIFGSVLTQAWILGVLGTIFGLLGGLTTAFVIHFCSDALLGYTPVFAFNGWLVLGGMIGTAIIVTIAAWLPARTASLVNPRDLLQFE